MAITFPRELPSYKLVTATFHLQPTTVSVASHGGNKINLTQIADPVWSLDVQTVPLWPREKREWTAWFNSLRGGLGQFLAYDPTRNPPAAYPDAVAPGQVGAGWDGTAAVTGLGASGALALSGLPAGYKASVGDRVSLVLNGAYGYYEVLEDVTANGSGVATLPVSPFLHTSVFTTSAVAHLWKPKAKFIIDGPSWSNEVSVEPTPISFRAVQRVMA